MKLIMKRSLRDGFMAMIIVKTDSDMVALGKAFSPAASPEHNDGRDIKILANGDSGAGKTHFFLGLFNSFMPTHGIDIEDLNRAPVVASDDDISLCHYDELDDPNYTPQTSDKSMMTLVCIENSEDNHRNFQLNFKAQADGSRIVTLKCSQEEAEQPGVEEFFENLNFPQANAA
jgi:tRNA A37 threonylcarbamoyladenosine biosynthesis protein TsaE